MDPPDTSPPRRGLQRSCTLLLLLLLLDPLFCRSPLGGDPGGVQDLHHPP